MAKALDKYLYGVYFIAQIDTPRGYMESQEKRDALEDFFNSNSREYQLRIG